MSNTGSQAKSATQIALEGGVKGPRVIVSLDNNGAYAVVTLSATGLGSHVRWYYPDDDESPEDSVNPDIPKDHPLFSLSPLSSLASIPSQEDSETDQRFVTPPPSGLPVDSSVLRTPVNKLRRHDDRLGYQGDPFWKDTSGVQEELAFLPEGHTAPRAMGLDQIQNIQCVRDQLTKLIDNGIAAKLFFNGKSKNAEAGPSGLSGLNEGLDLSSFVKNKEGIIQLTRRSSWDEFTRTIGHGTL